MSSLNIEEKEQLAEIKTWWAMYGNKVLNALLVVAAVALAWFGYSSYQNKQASEASATYYTLLRHVASKDLAKTKALAGELSAKYPRTNYAKFGAMLLARLSYENGDKATAKAQLTWVVHASDHEIRDIARLNLVSILVDEKAYDEALKQLAEPHQEASNSRFLNMQGDIALLRGQRSEAKRHFSAALAALNSGKTEGTHDESLLRILVQQKLDGLEDV